MSNAASEPQEPVETVTVPVPGPKRIRKAARSVKHGVVNAATHPMTKAAVRGTGRGVGIVGLAVVSAAAHGLALGYAQNTFTASQKVTTLPTRTAPKVQKVA